MKKILFSLMTLVALVVIAGSAMAQDKFTPYPGGTYIYELPYELANDGKIALTVTGGDLSLGTTSPSGLDVSGTEVNVSAGAGTISIPITFTSTALGTKRISIVITDESTNGCTNNIYLDVIMSSLPTYTLDIVASISETCQTRTGADDNTADALGDDTEANTFTYSVTPVVSGVTGNFTYSYTIDLPDNTVLSSFDNGSGDIATYSGGVVTYTNVSAVTTDVFTVTFNTTTGADAQTLEASLSIGASSTLIPANGGGIYNATTASGGSLIQSVVVKAVPTIGSFQ